MPLQYANTLPYYMTAGELAKELYPALNYDLSLPQPWVDHVRKQTGIDPAHWPARCIWGHPEHALFGQPFPLTIEARELLESLND